MPTLHAAGKGGLSRGVVEVVKRCCRLCIAGKGDLFTMLLTGASVSSMWPEAVWGLHSEGWPRIFGGGMELRPLHVQFFAVLQATQLRKTSDGC